MGVTRQELEIVIGEDGTVSIQVEGVQGKRCLDATQFLEEALGEVQERVHTREYYQEEEGDVNVEHRWRK